MMRKMLVAAAAVALTFGGISASEAQRRADPAAVSQVPANQRYCRDAIVDRNSTTMLCMHATYQQCLESRAAPSERCYLNPRIPYSEYR